MSPFLGTGFFLYPLKTGFLMFSGAYSKRPHCTKMKFSIKDFFFGHIFWRNKSLMENFIFYVVPAAWNQLSKFINSHFPWNLHIGRNVKILIKSTNHKHLRTKSMFFFVVVGAVASSSCKLTWQNIGGPLKLSTLKQRIIGQCHAGPYPNVARSWQALYDDQRKTNNRYFSWAITK